MPESKATSQLRRTLQKRSRRWRRRQVIGFYLGNLIILLVTLGGDPRTFRNSLFVIRLLVVECTAVSRWSRAQQRVVATLDDHAQSEFKANFDQLSGAEQTEMLRQYRPFGSLPVRIPDERQEHLRLQATTTAFRLLRPALLCFAAAYWMVYLWMPAGGWREMLTDSPVLISWLVLFVISLPQVVEMWAQPDDVGEPRVVRPKPQFVL